MSAARSDETGLRAKYLDWCSARIADRFLELSPEEIYRLAVEQEGADFAGDGTEPVESLSYRALVERVTRVLAARLGLPGFERWREDYQANPERYDTELVGFWSTARPSE
jgi:hypothetical protein